MAKQKFDPRLLSTEDYQRAHKILGGDYQVHNPDLVIAPDGQPYLYRWHVIKRSSVANCYFHIQVASDPERPLHDHPWDNQSVILAGGYNETYNVDPRGDGNLPVSRSQQRRLNEFYEMTRKVRKGDVIHRKAEVAHRLVLPPEIPYTMTLFSTGPKRRDWGFWYPDGFRRFEDVTRTEGNISIHVKGINP